MTDNMPDQRLFRCQCFGAYMALEHIFTGMLPSMVHHIMLLNKPFLTNVTLERFIPRVDHYVPL